MTEEETSLHVDALRKFVDAAGGTIIESTFYAKTTSAPSPLYNVRGSTTDPYPQKPGKVTGWKSLLEGQGFGAPCYATAPLPAPGKGKSHPGFDVGGHMTTDPNGAVAKGGSCYLMPLCKWHNNSNNIAAFTPRSTSMLVLSGYMQADTAVTFMARHGGAAPHAIVYLSDVEPTFEPLDASPVEKAGAFSFHDCRSDGLPEHFVVLRRTEYEGRQVYRIEHSSFD